MSNGINQADAPGRRAVLTGAVAIAIGAGAPSAAAAARRRPPFQGSDPLDFTAIPLSQQADARERLIDVGGARLWAWDTGGSGPVIVLLHPLSGSAATWPYQQPVFSRAGYRVIGYSRRGHFKSDAGTVSEPGIASEDLRKVLDAFGVKRFHAIGMAAGGLYATDFALSYPERVSSLVLGGSLVAFDDATYMKASNNLRPAGFYKLPPDFRELGPVYRAANEAGVARWRQIEAEAVHTPLQQRTTNKLTLDALSALSMPVLLATGDADLFTPPPMLKLLATRIANKTVEVVDNAGHAMHWEQPQVFNRVVLDFIQRK
jgi:pimeloyl-ACP methyl ester carboxylesterase